MTAAPYNYTYNNVQVQVLAEVCTRQHLDSAITALATPTECGRYSSRREGALESCIQISSVAKDFLLTSGAIYY